jgi:hypothetical protein
MLANARAVSVPMPEAPPVTMTRYPVKSMPSVTSEVVELNPKPVVILAMGLVFFRQVGKCFS